MKMDLKLRLSVLFTFWRAADTKLSTVHDILKMTIYGVRHAPPSVNIFCKYRLLMIYACALSIHSRHIIPGLFYFRVMFTVPPLHTGTTQLQLLCSTLQNHDQST